MERCLGSARQRIDLVGRPHLHCGLQHGAVSDKFSVGLPGGQRGPTIILALDVVGLWLFRGRGKRWDTCAVIGPAKRHGQIPGADLAGGTCLRVTP